MNYTSEHYKSPSISNLEMHYNQVGAHGTGAGIPPVDEQVVAMKLVTPNLGTIELSNEQNPALFRMAKVRNTRIQSSCFLKTITRGGNSCECTGASYVVDSMGSEL